ncbi:MAG: SoxR reducing system RseC family protein [Clostridia bacterium]|nr:SoxR reducing system RseC family protein [Clostridia bacterium]
MTEKGVIVKTEKERAIVRVDKKDECSKCGMCLFPKGASFIEYSATNDINAKVGDSVVIEMQKDAKFLAVFLVFLVPLILIGVAFLLNHFITKSDVFLLIFSLGLIILWFFILGLIDKKIKKISGFSPKIIKITEEKEC